MIDTVKISFVTTAAGGGICDSIFSVFWKDVRYDLLPVSHCALKCNGDCPLEDIQQDLDPRGRQLVVVDLGVSTCCHSLVLMLLRRYQRTVAVVNSGLSRQELSSLRRCGNRVAGAQLHIVEERTTVEDTFDAILESL